MSSQSKQARDAKLDEHIRLTEERASRTQHIFRHVLHILERAVAVITLVVLVISLGIQIFELVINPASMADVSGFLHHTLTIVVGLEFVRMLIDTTPASILEVLTVAITRHVILSHDDPVSNLLSVACIAGLFAIRRYLFRRGELKEEMVEKE